MIFDDLLLKDKISANVTILVEGMVMWTAFTFHKTILNFLGKLSEKMLTLFAYFIVIEGVALFTGFLSIIGKYSVKKSTSKAEKHEKIKTIASTKLDTISSHISKALSDNKVTDEEFRLILEELEKCKVMKEVRSKTKKKIATGLEETLIERERQEAHNSFRKLVEKDNTRS